MDRHEFLDTVEGALRALGYTWYVHYDPMTNDHFVQIKKSSGEKFTTSMQDLMRKCRTSDDLFLFFEEEYNRE